jgi:hypothetical protein
VLVPVAVSRASDLALVERVTLDVANATVRDVVGAITDSAPSIIYPLGFDDYVVRFTVTLRVAGYADQQPVRAAFIQRLEARYLAEGITMYYPVAQPPMNGHPSGAVSRADERVARPS